MKPTPLKSNDLRIKENLRRVYREVEDEELPERFARLLEELKRRGGDGGGKGA